MRANDARDALYEAYLRVPAHQHAEIEKLPYYAEHGVGHAWLVDPIDKRLEVYALDAGTRRWREVRIHQGDTAVRAAPFDAIELGLPVLWSPPRLT